MKLRNYKLLFVIVIAALLVPFTAHATEVDYDAVDEAALRMVAQTSVLQAADQFHRVYQQILIYDTENYQASYDYDNLVGSVVAGAVVRLLDPDWETYATLDWWAASIVNFGCDNLGYTENGAKLQALGQDCEPLASSRSGIGAACSAGWDGIVWCLGLGISNAVAWGSALVASVGVLVGGGVGLACAKAAAVVFVAWCAVCICVGVYDFYMALCGFALVGVSRSLFRRRK